MNSKAQPFLNSLSNPQTSLQTRISRPRKWRPSKMLPQGCSLFFILSLSFFLFQFGSLVEPYRGVFVLRLTDETSFPLWSSFLRAASFSSFLRFFEREAAPRASRCFICLSALFITCNLALARARVISYWFSASLHTPRRSAPSSTLPLLLPSYLFLFFLLVASVLAPRNQLPGNAPSSGYMIRVIIEATREYCATHCTHWQ